MAKYSLGISPEPERDWVWLCKELDRRSEDEHLWFSIPDPTNATYLFINRSISNLIELASFGDFYDDDIGRLVLNTWIKNLRTIHTLVGTLHDSFHRKMEHSQPPPPLPTPTPPHSPSAN